MARRGKDAWGLWVLALTVPLAFAGAPSVEASEGTPLLIVYGSAYREQDLALWPSNTNMIVENITKGIATSAYISETRAGKYTAVLAVFTGGWAASPGDTLRYSIPESLGAVVNPLHVVGQDEVDISTMRVHIFIAEPNTSAGSPPNPSGLLLRAFPNPISSGAVRFVFRVAARDAQEVSNGRVDLTIVDAGGRERARFRVQLATQSEGAFEWDLHEPGSARMPAGVYFATVRAGRDASAVKFVVLK